MRPAVHNGEKCARFKLLRAPLLVAESTLPFSFFSRCQSVINIATLCAILAASLCHQLCCRTRYCLLNFSTTLLLPVGPSGLSNPSTPTSGSSGGSTGGGAVGNLSSIVLGTSSNIPLGSQLLFHRPVELWLSRHSNFSSFRPSSLELDAPAPLPLVEGGGVSAPLSSPPLSCVIDSSSPHFASCIMRLSAIFSCPHF